jgi:hypothetical protein
LGNRFAKARHFWAVIFQTGGYQYAARDDLTTFEDSAEAVTAEHQIRNSTVRDSGAILPSLRAQFAK